MTFQEPTRIPGAYLDHYPRAREIDPEGAANHVTHTTFGDPLANAMIADLEALGAERSTKLIERCMRGKGGKALRSAPASVRDCFEHCAEPPAWLDLRGLLPGCRMFHRNVPLVLAGMLSRIKRLAEKLNPRHSRPVEDITRSLDVSMYDEGGISYHLPDNPHAGLSSKW